jgi:MFS transporter, OPA family, glycerol-3-phosphate transporter
MPLLLDGLFLAVVVGLHCYNNPRGQGSWFMARRFVDWFPLGTADAFLSMERHGLKAS